MPHEKLLQEFETRASAAEGLNSFLQHISQRLHEEMTRYNWVGFYFMEAPAFDALVLGPYVGSFMPTLRITLDQRIVRRGGEHAENRMRE